MADSIAYRGLRYRKSIVVRPNVTPDPGPPVFTPASLVLTGWWKGGDYDDSGTGVWTGTASAGTSGTKNLIDNTYAGAYKPAVGSSINGIPTVSFVDNFRWLETQDALDNYINSNGGLMFMVAYITSVGTSATPPNVYTNDTGFSANGGFAGFRFSSTGPSVYGQVYTDSGEFSDNTSFSLSTSTLFVWKFESGRVYISKNNDSFGAGTAVTNTINAGVMSSNHIATTGPTNFVGRVCEIITAESLTNTEITNLRAYLVTKWGIV